MRYRYTIYILAICVLLCGTLVFAQSAQFPAEAPAQVNDGLDNGGNQYTTQNMRPPDGWEEQGPLYRKVERIEAACFSSCHGKSRMDKDPSIPNIAGQKFPVIIKQMELFNKNGAGAEAIRENLWTVWHRSNYQMDRIAGKVKSDMYLYIADLVSKRSCDSEREVVEPSVLAMPPKTLTKCIVCHGIDGRGEAFDIPNLAGQSESYLRNQLLAIRKDEKGVAENKAERFRNHPVMGAVLGALTDAEIRDLAKHYAEGDCRSVQ
ncbi:c-type cytochrome [Pseudomonadota bacterium]